MPVADRFKANRSTVRMWLRDAEKAKKPHYTPLEYERKEHANDPSKKVYVTAEEFIRHVAQDIDWVVDINKRLNNLEKKRHWWSW